MLNAGTTPAILELVEAVAWATLNRHCLLNIKHRHVHQTTLLSRRVSRYLACLRLLERFYHLGDGELATDKLPLAVIMLGRLLDGLGSLVNSFRIGSLMLLFLFVLFRLCWLCEAESHASLTFSYNRMLLPSEGLPGVVRWPNVILLLGVNI